VGGKEWFDDSKNEFGLNWQIRIKEVLLFLLFGIHMPKINVMPDCVIEFHLRLVWNSIFGNFYLNFGFNI